MNLIKHSNILRFQNWNVRFALSLLKNKQLLNWKFVLIFAKQFCSYYLQLKIEIVPSINKGAYLKINEMLSYSNTLEGIVLIKFCSSLNELEDFKMVFSEKSIRGADFYKWRFYIYKNKRVVYI